MHNDEPTLLDNLDRQALIREVGEAIATCNPPQVFGVHGDWGMGKTSFLHQVQWDLTGSCPQQPENSTKASTEQRPHKKNAIRAVWFDAWRYQHEDAPVIALLQEIRAQLSAMPRAGKAAVAIRGALLSIEDVTKKIGFQYSKFQQANREWAAERISDPLPSYTIRVHLREAIDQILQRGARKADPSRRLAIFIDDIDRCEPDAAFRLLESIDKFRGIYSGAADLPFKKRWLARVGFEMQRRRDAHGASDRSEILVDGADVLSWVREEMQRNSAGGIDDPEQFLQFVKRRSGLLLPRGENQFAFIHLSFQEYFAAHALRREVTTPTWIRKGTSPLGFERELLAQWGRSDAWTETLVFLFEMLSADEDWYDDLRVLVFGDHFAKLCSSDSMVYHLNVLLSRVASGPRSRFSVSDVLDEIRQLGRGRSIQEVSFAGLRVFDLSLFYELTSLRSLVLDLTPVSDLAPVASLTCLDALRMIGTQVSDLSPLADLSSLRFLHLGGARISDLTPLAGLTSLRVLYLDDMQVSDLSPLAGLKVVERISLLGTQVSDLTPLSDLISLRTLLLDRTKVSESAVNELRDALPDCEIAVLSRGPLGR